MKNLNETNQKSRIYLPNQLIAMLPAIALKVLQYFCGWSTATEIKFNLEQLINILHLSENEINVAVQTLLDHKLMRVSNGLVEFNREQIQRYYDIPFSKVMESKGIQLATDVTWNKQPETPQQKGIEDMSVSEMKSLLLNISARLNEHELSKKYIVSNEPNDDQLPW